MMSTVQASTLALSAIAYLASPAVVSAHLSHVCLSYNLADLDKSKCETQAPVTFYFGTYHGAKPKTMGKSILTFPNGETLHTEFNRGCATTAGSAAKSRTHTLADIKADLVAQWKVGGTCNAGQFTDPKTSLKYDFMSDAHTVVCFSSTGSTVNTISSASANPACSATYGSNNVEVFYGMTTMLDMSMAGDFKLKTTGTDMDLDPASSLPCTMSTNVEAQFTGAIDLVKTAFGVSAVVRCEAGKGVKIAAACDGSGTTTQPTCETCVGATSGAGADNSAGNVGGSDISSNTQTCKGCLAAGRTYVNTSSCPKCAAGQYDHDSNPMTACTPCTGLGKYAPEGGTTCVDCPVGRYDNTPTESKTCYTCPAGKYSAGGTADCNHCAATFWDHDSDGATPCQSCPAGNYGATGNTWGVHCTTCPAGKFAAVSSVQYCADGTSAPTPAPTKWRAPAGPSENASADNGNLIVILVVFFICMLIFCGVFFCLLKTCQKVKGGGSDDSDE